MLFVEFREGTKESNINLQKDPDRGNKKLRYVKYQALALNHNFFNCDVIVD